jgi:hypothetical protein
MPRTKRNKNIDHLTFIGPSRTGQDRENERLVMVAVETMKSRANNIIELYREGLIPNVRTAINIISTLSRSNTVKQKEKAIRDYESITHAIDERKRLE